MVRTYYIQRDKRLRDLEYRRGRMVVRSEAEWRERWTTVNAPRRRKVATVLLSVYLLVLIAVLSLWVAGALEGEGLVNAALFMFWLSAVVFMPILTVRHYDLHGPTMGLYQLGVQVHDVFVPYWEIDSTRRVEMGGGREFVAMAPRHPVRIFPFKSLEPWTLAVDFLGEDGVAELERRVSIAVRPGS